MERRQRFETGKGTAVAYFKTLSQHSRGKTGETHRALIEIGCNPSILKWLPPEYKFSTILLEVNEGKYARWIRTHDTSALLHLR
jgi:hypothetical protein